MALYFYHIPLFVHRKSADLALGRSTQCYVNKGMHPTTGYTPVTGYTPATGNAMLWPPRMNSPYGQLAIRYPEKYYLGLVPYCVRKRQTQNPFQIIPNIFRMATVESVIAKLQDYNPGDKLEDLLLKPEVSTKIKHRNMLT